MSHMSQIHVPATYIRGGTSKGVFFNIKDLPEFAQTPGEARDQFLMRVIGSPDPYSNQIDGMGGATSSTSKTVLVEKSASADHDVDYYFGQVAIDKPFVDWSGNCGNLTCAVGAFAIHQGMLDEDALPENGIAEVKIWQANIKKTIIARVPIHDRKVQELGDFELDGVAFPAAEINVEFLDPADGKGDMFPTGNVVDELVVPGVGSFQASFVDAGIPSIFINANALGFTGTESQADVNGDSALLAKLETIRSYGALKMGLITKLGEAETRQHTPKIAWVAPARGYTASDGKTIQEHDIDVCVRAMSMGKLHHAMMGTAAVCIASAAAVPGTLVNLAAGGGERSSVIFGHPSGSLKVGAVANLENDKWRIQKAIMSRSARIIMQGQVHVPAVHMC